MYSLSSVMNEASGALGSANAAIAVTSNNVSNVNTPGYTRQIVSLSSSALQMAGGFLDNGVSFDGFSSSRDSTLQQMLNQQQSAASSLDAQSASWTQIQAGFQGTASGIGAAMTSLFSTISALSTSPADGAARQTAFNAAQEVTNAFHQAADTLNAAATAADQVVSDTVTQINGLTGQIAALDQHLGGTASHATGTAALQDQRDELTSKLAQLAGLTLTKTNTTTSVALSDGTPLIVDGQAFQLSLTRAADGTQHITDSEGLDITAALTGGTLGGNLEMLDRQVPQVLSSLNLLASQFATAMNQAQSQGYDLSGVQGQPLFSVSGSGNNVAASLALSLSAPSGLALSSDGTAGSSGNVGAMLDVQTTVLPSGESPGDTYASLVQSVGTSASQASSSLSARDVVIGSLSSLQNSESGVSIDEETTNLLRYQQAYSAAAQVISTVNSLFSVLMNMGTAG